MRAYCYPSGLIDFGTSVPKGAKVIARGPEQALREFVAVKARHSRQHDGFLVPGVPEANDAVTADAALERWTRWIAQNPPAGVRVLPPARPQTGEAA